MKRWVLVLCLQLMVWIGYSQTLQHYATEQGTTFYKVYQTKRGKLFFGTDKGLYTLENKKIVRQFIPPNLHTGMITALFEDHSEQLWIGFNDGKIGFLSKNYQYQEWNIPEGHPAVKIVDIREDPQHKMWFATHGEGVYVYDNQKYINIDKDDGLSSNDSYCMELDPEGKIWLGTDDGINICTFQNGQKHIEKKTSDIIYFLTYSEEEKMMIAGYQIGGYFTQFFGKTKDSGFFPLADQEFENQHSITFSKPETWIATDSKIYTTCKGECLFTYKELNFDLKKIQQLYQDRQGNFWILDAKHKVSSVVPLFKNETFDTPPIQTLDIFLGTQNGLYYNQLNRKIQKVTIPNCPNPNVISQLDSEWFGTFGQGLYNFNTDKFIKGLNDENIFSLVAYQDKILAATLAGVSAIDKQTHAVSDFSKQLNIKPAYTYKLLTTKSDSILWMATDGLGLIQVKNNSVRYFNELERKPFKTVYAIAEDTMQRIWISIPGIGLAYLENNQLLPFKGNNAIRNTNILSIVCDTHNNLIVCHDEGVDYVLPETGEVFPISQYFTDFVPNFSLNSSVYSQDGVNLASGNHIYTILFNQIIRPQIWMEPIEIDGIKSEVEKSIFKYDENNLHFKFGVNFFNNDQDLKLFYQLEGYHNVWESRNIHEIEYANLPAGNYTLRAYMTKGTFRSNVIEYSFTIEKVFWKKWWFILLSAMLMTLLIYTIIKLREKRQQVKSEMEKDVLNAQLEALRSQINPHFLFNTLNTLVSVIEDNPKEAVEFVNKLSDFFRKLLGMRERSIISIQEELSLTKDYAYLVKQRFQTGIQINIDDQEAFGGIYPLTLQILIENAIKHNVVSTKNPIVVDIKLSKNQIVVKNNKIPKLQKEPSTGFGLDYIKRHYQYDFKKEISIQDSAEQFLVILPVINLPQ